MRNFEPVWDVEYDCSVLPNASSWNNAVGINMMSIIDDILYINDNSTSSGSWLGMENVVNDDTITTFECNIKIVNTSKYFSLAMQMIDSQKGILLGLEPNKINIIDSSLKIIKSIDVDLTNFNTIKLIKYEQTRFEIYINGNLIGGSNYFYNQSNSNGLWVGAISVPETGNCYIKNVRYCLDGIPIYYSDSYVIKQNSNYYSINNNYIDLRTIDNSEELNNIIDEYGYNDISILTKELNSKKIPTKLENDYYKSFDINLNDIKDSMNLIEENDKKYIEYGCNNYRISDEVKKINDSKFEILMKE
ncbi:hypothetical protein NHI66_002114 [Clostridium botulinum]|nr:hypothetical protein [Clostridium botulinum]